MWKLDQQVRTLESGERYRAVRDQLLARDIDPYTAADQLLREITGE
jgi:hypothetical protein